MGKMTRSLSLRSKILTFTIGVIVVLVGLSLTIIHTFVSRQVARQVQERLERTKSVFEHFMEERARWLETQCAVVAEDPRFTATLDIHGADLATHAQTVLREARRFQNIIGSDVFLVTNAAGVTLSRLEVVSSADRVIPDTLVVARALRGEASVETWQDGTRSYRTGTVPILRENRIIGTLSVGFAGDIEEGLLLEDLVTVSADLILRPKGPIGKAQALALVREILAATVEADLVAICGNRGQPLANVVRSVSYGEDLSTSARIQEALKGEVTIGSQADSLQIMQLVVVPVFTQGKIVGALGAGFAIDDDLAQDLRTMMQSEVTFAVDGAVVASTWDRPVRKILEQTVFQTGDELLASQEPFRTEIGDEAYLSLVGQRIDQRGDAKGYSLIQLSLDEPSRFLNLLEQVLVLLGLVILAIAAVVSFTGVTRITRPILALVEGTRRLAAGELVHRVRATSQDEVGELAQSFNDMAGELTRSHEALTESERRYRDLFDSAQDILYTTDREMRLTSMNQAFLERTGYSSEELVGRPFYDLLSEEDAARLRDLEDHEEPDKLRSIVEVQLVGKGRRRLTVEIVSRWISDRGTVVGTHGIGRDVTERRVREQLERELQVAHDMQMDLLPENPPEVPGVGLSGICLPANHVGGDYYQYVPMADGRLGIVIADVSGHAMQAATIVMRFNEMLRYELRDRTSPVEILEGLDRSLQGQIPETMFVTCGIGVWDPRDRSFSLASAANPEVYHYIRAEDVVKPLGIAGLPLGLTLPADTKVPFGCTRVTMSTGDVLVLTSDGVEEALNGSEEFYEAERLSSLIGELGRKGTSADTMRDGITEDVKAFIGDAAQSDDITVVVAKAT
jgi:PAS domain S-box-containing protein